MYYAYYIIYNGNVKDVVTSTVLHCTVRRYHDRGFGCNAPLMSDSGSADGVAVQVLASSLPLSLPPSLPPSLSLSLSLSL